MNNNTTSPESCASDLCHTPNAPTPDGVGLVVFDVDNTLLDTLELIVACFNTAMEPILGRAYATAEVVAFFGPTEEQLLRRLTPPGQFDEVLSQFHRTYDKGLHALSLYPGMKEILDKLHHAGIPMGISTGKGRYSTESTLRHFTLEKHFRWVMTGDDVQKNKPHPEPMLRLAQLAGIPTGKIVMVGDSLADVRTANAAGATSLLVLWGRHETRPGQDEIARREAHVLFHRVEELDAWFDERGVYGRKNV